VTPADLLTELTKTIQALKQGGPPQPTRYVVPAWVRQDILSKYGELNEGSYWRWMLARGGIETNNVKQLTVSEGGTDDGNH
jgi:hypothetical protein